MRAMMSSREEVAKAMTSSAGGIAEFVEQLRQRGFGMTPRPEGDGYGIAVPEDELGKSTRLLLVDGRLLEEYVGSAVSGWGLPPGTTDRREEVLSLMVTYVEAALTSVDANGRNHVTELGLRRHPDGRVDWYQVEDSPRIEPARSSADPDLRWVADRPLAPE